MASFVNFLRQQLLSPQIFQQAEPEVPSVTATPGIQPFAGSNNADIIFGRLANDFIVALGGNDVVFNREGNDTTIGGNANDLIFGDRGNNLIVGSKGKDTLFGGRGDDRFIWNDGDGSDVIHGGEGFDVVEVNGSNVKGEIFTLHREGDKAIFDRNNLGPFTLTVDSIEKFEINGLDGDDSLTMSDLNRTGVGEVDFLGGAGNDRLDAATSRTPVFADGGTGGDVLIGGLGNDTLTGGAGVDTLTGGGGHDRFLFAGNPFADGAPVAAANGIKVLNKPDIITDFQLSDRLALDGSDLGINQLVFGQNLIVLQTPFANAAAAAKSIANNDAITADQGAFVYFNTTLGLTRFVYSTDLSDGGDISVLANLANQKDPSILSGFTDRNFVLV